MSIAFPNEPSGTTPVMDWGHNALTGGGWYDIYNGYMTSIISDGTAPLSPSNVLQQRFPQGLVGGYGGGGVIHARFQHSIRKACFMASG